MALRSIALSYPTSPRRWPTLALMACENRQHHQPPCSYILANLLANLASLSWPSWIDQVGPSRRRLVVIQARIYASVIGRKY